MTKLPASVADELGRRLHDEGFRPLPDVDDDGELIGTRLWRVRGGYVEYLALRHNGLAYALRAEASFDYRRPTDHGAVVAFQTGHATNALDWLLRCAAAPNPRLPRGYVRLAVSDEGGEGVIGGSLDESDVP
ncbi:hypothetical protein [Actinophytocola sp.]|uniref:hypothetical protein n=1 Tax=Actinophytocola sp. TaxID=1872138 RepID=UPI0025C6CC5B|nr:hypothetical protein [Actinophytocola sp.]